MEDLQKTVSIKNRLGLHARAASLFVQVANRFQAEIYVKKFRDSAEVNGKSLLGIMTLAAIQGERIIIKAKGCDARLAMQELVKLIENRFGED